MSGARPPSAASVAAAISSGSVPWKAKMACFRSPTQIERRARSLSAPTTASWSGEVSWNSSTSTRSSRARSASCTAGRAEHVARLRQHVAEVDDAGRALLGDEDAERLAGQVEEGVLHPEHVLVEGGAGAVLVGQLDEVVRPGGQLLHVHLARELELALPGGHEAAVEDGAELPAHGGPSLGAFGTVPAASSSSLGWSLAWAALSFFR